MQPMKTRPRGFRTCSPFAEDNDGRLGDPWSNCRRPCSRCVTASGSSSSFPCGGEYFFPALEGQGPPCVITSSVRRGIGAARCSATGFVMSVARRSPATSARGRSRVDGALDAEALAAAIRDDAVSYAAGLSRMRCWRFALATLAVIVPASFLLAHFGSVAMEGEAGAITWILAIPDVGAARLGRPARSEQEEGAETSLAVIRVPTGGAVSAPKPRPARVSASDGAGRRSRRDGCGQRRRVP